MKPRPTSGQESDAGRLARQLIDAVDSERHIHPRRACARALAARDFVASLSLEEMVENGDRLGPAQRRWFERRRWLALQCEAWAVLASAQRGVGELVQAESSMLVALHFLGELSPADTVRRARISLRAGYIRLDQGRIDEALELFREGRRLYLENGCSQRAAAARVDIAVALARGSRASSGSGGQAREAVEQLAAALEVLDRDVEPRSYLAALHNLARLLLELAEGPLEEIEALRWLELASREHRLFPEPLNLLRLRAVAALTAARLGRVEAALSSLDELAAEFEAIGSVGDQALARLYAAEIALRYPSVDGPGQRRPLEIAGRLFPLLNQLPIHSATKSVLIRLLAHVETHGLEADAVRRAAAQLEISLGV